MRSRFWRNGLRGGAVVVAKAFVGQGDGGRILARGEAAGAGAAGAVGFVHRFGEARRVERDERLDVAGGVDGDGGAVGVGGIENSSEVGGGEVRGVDRGDQDARPALPRGFVESGD